MVTTAKNERECGKTYLPIPVIHTFHTYIHLLPSLSIQRILLLSNRNHQKKSIPLEYD
jgi:hypothetical protein